MPALTVILLIGATVRLTRLFTTDYIFEPVRSMIENRASERFSYMVRCDWCVSVWAGAGIFLFGWYAPATLVLILSGALTASLVTGWLGHLEAALESKVEDFE